MNVHYHTRHKCIESDRMADPPFFDYAGDSMETIRRLLLERHSGHVDQVLVHTDEYFGLGAHDLQSPVRHGYTATFLDNASPLAVNGSVSNAD